MWSIGKVIRITEMNNEMILIRGMDSEITQTTKAKQVCLTQQKN